MEKELPQVFLEDGQFKGCKRNAIKATLNISEVYLLLTETLDLQCLPLVQFVQPSMGSVDTTRWYIGSCGHVFTCITREVAKTTRQKQQLQRS